MFDALTQSDVAAIRDLAMARTQLDRTSSPSTTDMQRDAQSVRIAERIAALSPAAQAELAALVRLGADGIGVPWETIVDEAERCLDHYSAVELAMRPALDELIERGLLKLRDREETGRDG